MSEYPHWKTALFGNGHIANLRCAFKYFLWHGLYALLAVLGAVLYAGYRVGVFIESNAPSGRIGGAFAAVGRGVVGAAQWIHGVVTSDRAVDALLLVMLGMLVAVLVALVWYAITNPIIFLASVGGATLIVLALVGLVLAWDEWLEDIVDRALARLGTRTVNTVIVLKRTGSKATQKPGLRRIYNECPVSLHMKPKWFEAIDPEEA